MLGKLLLGFLAVLLITPVFLLSRPQKAEALVSLAQCGIAKGIQAGIASVKATAAALIGIPSSDVVGTESAAEGTAGTDWTSCFLRSLTKIIAKTILHTFTQSIVEWINSGFEGGPSFVTNPEGFLADIGDQAIGRVIQDVYPFLCSPFRLNIRFSLGLNIGYRSRQQTHCTLSDVIDNVRGAYDGFVRGAAGSGNLSNWIHIAGTQSNNPYGAYVAVNHEMAIGITSATGQKVKEWDWGKGFMSWRSCDKRAPDVREANGRVTRKGECIREGKIKTPGSFIQDQTTGAFATTFRELELADEIDEIAGALVNQLLVKAMSAGGGLLGSSKGGITSGGRSATSALLTDPDRALKLADKKPPAGINCDIRYYPSTEKKTLSNGRDVFVPNEQVHQVWTDKLETEAEYASLEENERTATLKKARNAAGAEILKPSGQTWESYFEQINVGCINRWSTLVDDASGRSLPGYAERRDEGTKPPVTPPPPSNEDRKIHLATAALKQSHEFTRDGVPRGPLNAAIGASFSDTREGRDHWWTASLNKTESIKILTVKSFRNSEYTAGVGRIVLAEFPPGHEKLGAPIYPQDVVNVKYEYPGVACTADAGVACTTKIQGDAWDLTITFSQPVRANAIVISNTSALILSSVQAFRPIETTPAGSAPPAPFAFTTAGGTTEPIRLLWSSNPTLNTLEWGSASFTPNKSEDDIDLRARLYVCPTETCTDVHYAAQTPAAFYSHFSALGFTYSNGGQPERLQNAITVGSTGRTHDTTPGTGVAEDPNGSVPGVFIAQNLTVEAGKPVTLSLTGVRDTNMKAFRIIFDALDKNGRVWSVNADFKQ